MQPAPGADSVILNYIAKSATEVELVPAYETELAPGEYPNATIIFGIARNSDKGLVTEAANIPVRLVVGE